MSKLIKNMTLEELRNGYAELEFEVDMLRYKLDGKQFVDSYEEG